MTGIVRRVSGTPLTEEQRAELRALAAMPDEQIDFSDIPERVYPSDPLPLEEHVIRLRVDADVAKWLENAGEAESNVINQTLRRVRRRSQPSSLNTTASLQKTG